MAGMYYAGSMAMVRPATEGVRQQKNIMFKRFRLQPRPMGSVQGGQSNRFQTMSSPSSPPEFYII